MNKERIAELVAKGEIRTKEVNKAQAQSLIQAALDSAAFAKSATLNEQTATGAFKEVYDAFRQLGDAKWWTLGYESYSHKASIELLKTAPVPEKQQLQQLSRILELRNDATYRGHRVAIHETKALFELWEQTHEHLITWINEK